MFASFNECIACNLKPGSKPDRLGRALTVMYLMLYRTSGAYTLLHLWDLGNNVNMLAQRGASKFVAGIYFMASTRILFASS